MKIINKLQAVLVLILFSLSTGLFAQPDRSNNPIAQYYNGSDDAYPEWIDNIRWNNRIDMSTYSNGSTNFQKFENARDEAYNAGGGVLYYPAGTYNFTIPDQGPNGRGLMLKSGVVILGATPTGDKVAVDDGNIQLLTKFNFSYSSTSVTRDGSSATVEYPGMWNLIGITPAGSEQLKDVKNVGIAWVELDGAVIYFGMQLNWASSWLASPWLGLQSVGPWAGRVANGTHPMDPFHGYASNTGYVGAGSGRLIFGCELNNAVATNDRTTKYTRTINSTLYQGTPIFADRFSPRLGVNGSNVFIANNAIPKPTRAFRYETMVSYRKNATPYNVAPHANNAHIMFDYGDQLGIDVNKSLLGTVLSSQRRDFATSPYYENNIVVNDNYVYNHGHKGYEISGEWVMIKNNKNIRDFLQTGDNVYGVGSNWVLTMEGFEASYETDDNMARAFDLNGKSVWVDNNYFNNVGSNPGNDGEGILAQQHNDIDVFSWAFTHNAKGPNGDASYMGTWSCNVFGFLVFKNTIPGGMVGAIAFTPPLYSLSVVDNGTATVKTDGVAHDVTTVCPSAGLSAPTNVVATYNTTKKCVILTWADNTANEIGYRIDRRVTPSGSWKTIYYRPKVSNTDPINISNYNYTNETDVNRPEFYDYLTANSAEVEYRVAAINCNDDNSAATVSNKVTVYSSSTVPVTSVTVSPTTATLAIAATQQLTQTVLPANATNKTVSWSTSNASVATVSSTGLVTAVAAGTATITVTTQDGNKTATCAVTVNTISVTGVTVSPTSATLAINATQQLTATVAPANATNKTVSWSTSNASVATVSSSGLVTAVAAGSATITVTTQDGNKTATCAVTVNPADAGDGLKADYFNTRDLTGSVIVTRIDPTVNFGWGTGSYATGQNTDNFSARWTGQVKPLYSETYTFETESDDGIRLWVNGQQLVNKWVDQGPTKWSGTISLTAGQKYDIKMEYYENGGGAVARLRWSSASQAYAIIPQAQLYSTSTVVAVTGVTVSPTSATLAINATQQLTATVAPANATNKTVSWSSSNTSVAAVNTSGLVTAVAAGTATITVTTQDGNKTATSAITVNEPVGGSVVYAINAGGAAFTATDGTVYEADRYFAGGSTYTTGTTSIANTTDDELYRSERYGNMSYEFPVTNGNYTVTLKFAEIYQTGTGKRQFDVAIEGVQSISNLDIFASAGGNYTAYDVIRDVTVSDGKLNIVFTTDIDNAKVSAILVKEPAQLKSTSIATEVASVGNIKFKAHPNPASGYLTLEGDNEGETLVYLINTYGQLVSTTKYNGKFTSNLDISALPAGIYFVKAVSGGFTDLKKVIIK